MKITRIGILIVSCCIINLSSFARTPWAYSQSGRMDYDGTTKQYPEENKKNNFTEANQPAKFPGGQSALQNYLRYHINYPEEARLKRKQGIVILQFSISSYGQISNICILNSPDESLSEEAIRVVKSMPNWLPAKSNGMEVSSSYKLNVKFSL
jgi:protein TonB